MTYFKPGLENSLDKSDSKLYLEYLKQYKDRDVALAKIVAQDSILAEKGSKLMISIHEYVEDLNILATFFPDGETVQKLGFFDTETSHMNGLVSSIAIISYDILKQETLSELYLEVNPGVTQEESAIEVHGLTDDYLADKPFYPQIADQVEAELMKNDVLVAHNSMYDIGVIIREYERMGKMFPPVLRSHYDTMPGFKNQLKFTGKKKNPSLKEAATAFGINLQNVTLHNALDDTRVLKEAFLLAANTSDIKEVNNAKSN